MLAECKYSIVIPVYNEQESLEPLRQNITTAMTELPGSYEVILIDDGSSDGSRELIQQIASRDPRFRFLVFDRNYGQSSAMAAGFKAAKGNIIITMDADLQVNAHDIPRLLEKLPGFDMVSGYREKRADTWSKRMASKIANAVRNRLTGETIKDTGCPLKVFKKEVLENMVFFDGMHRFFPALISMQGYSITEVPISHFRRQYGYSKYNIHGRLFKTFFDLLGVRWLKKRYLRCLVVLKK
jgi:glycosyltransferase involved in cell wall biosynthesis